MSMIPKHFGLKPREESYIFKELEKLRQDTKKDFLRLGHKLASRPLLEEAPIRRLQGLDSVHPAGQKSVSPARVGVLPAPPLARGPQAREQERLPSAARPRDLGEAAARPKTRTFRPQEFYLRSSAFRRYPFQKKPPLIASGVGTSKPVVLLPPPAPLLRPRARPVPVTPRPAASKQATDSARALEVLQELAPSVDPRRANARKTSSLSSEDSDVAPTRWRHVRITTHFLSQLSRGEAGEAAGPGLRAQRASRQASDGLEASWLTLPPRRPTPTSFKEIFTSLYSETQLASDQTIKELIQSILGPSYDFRMEDMTLTGKMHLKASQTQAETLHPQAEQGLERVVESVLEELPEAASSVLQMEQDDGSEWGDSEIESMTFKSPEISEVQVVEKASKPLEDVQLTRESKAGKQLLLKEKPSKLLHITGKGVKRVRKSNLGIPPLRSGKSSKFLRAQKLPKKIPPHYPTHHFHDLCSTIPAQELPVDLSLASRLYHTTNKKGHDVLREVFGFPFLDDRFTEEEQRARILYGIPVVSENQEYVSVPPSSPGILFESPQADRQRAETPYMQVLGEEMPAYPGLSKLLWSPAAPKFSVPESVMKKTLYPKYESVQTSLILSERFSWENEENIIIERSKSICRFLTLRKSASFGGIPTSLREESVQLKRVKSAFELRKEETTVPLEVKDDMQSNMKEVMFQKAKEWEFLLAQQEKAKASQPEKENIDVILDSIQEKETLRDLSFSLIEASRKAGITYIVYPKKTKMKLKRRLRPEKLTHIYEELSKPPKMIHRSTSHGILPGQKKYFIRLPFYERPIRSPSLPPYLNFDKFAESKGGIPENSNPRTWMLDTLIKYKLKKQSTEVAKVSVLEDLPKPVTELKILELSDYLKCDLPPEVIEHYESEVKILTEEIDRKNTFPVFEYCRRGAIYRKLGKLKSAMNDLQKVINAEPLFLNAYWHRHFIYLFQDKIIEALDDLNFISKHNKNNAEVYLSKAEIFRRQNDSIFAILNYSQAIKCRPTDADLYFRRGEMHEKQNRALAIDDFSKCIFYDPKRADALFKRGMFYYENENWILAIQDFTALLNIDHQNSQVRTYRGRAYFKQRFYKQATQDLSAAVHLDPNNWLALYYRACLFRRTNPFRALQDYSVSALINDGYENLSCFLHRGIIYANLKLWMLAICDFETAISLERAIVLPYINIGLIHLLHLDNYTEAIGQFSEAIRIDPLYIQSYICRAEAFHKVNKLKTAVNDLSRAIHLQPDGIQLYIIRGQYLLMMKNYELAKFTIYQVAEMNRGLIDLTPIQQALIYSFCENHQKAIQVLEGLTWSRPDIVLFAVIAKAHMKARRTKEAVRRFKEAVDAFALSDRGPNAMGVLADCLYNLGLCYTEEGNFQTAFEYFTKAVKVNPDFAESFYQRGLCKAKLRKDNSILDFNRAITLNPKHYQAYLSRVAYYGLKGRYSKAILNCNEAIKICPKNVRAYLYRGVLKYYNKTYKLAIRDLTIVINMDKRNYISFYNRAICYTKIGELQMALTDYGVVLLLDPGETITLNTFINRGCIYVELGQHCFAVEDFKQAALMSQTDVSLHQAAAVCHHRIEEFEEAVNFFTEALKINPHSLDAYIGRGNSYMEYDEEERTKQAQKDFVTVLHFNPAYTKARISLAYNLQAQGKFQKAWNHFTIALEADPKSYLAYEGRAVVCLQMGNNFAAMQDINVAIKINTTAEYLTNRGVIHESMGQQQNAMRDYQTAISLNPEYSLAYFNAGNIYFHHRQFSQARDYFSKALKFDPENEYARMNRAVAHTLLKNYEGAKEDFAHVIDSCPSWAAVYFNRAHLYCCLKQYELAEVDLNKALSLKPRDALIYNLRAEVRGKIGLIEEAVADYNLALDLEEGASVK
ncbi:tetratricopeptide repeat protein 6 isoform X2 [Ochotona princeps]|uniref:tetratricopeptide repeat protein 6 isoform X2 n=1 Tax=Ochotona princeps TaxID=9978 RepID=UPI0027147AE3|nr:tetratricopeptide repeat protein 6 isoform X2 [Ochotona princeps]